MRDRSTNNEIILDFEHYKVHDEEMFSVSYPVTVTAASTNEFMINTGTGEPHIKFSMASDGETKTILLEGITTSANGTSVTVRNMYRDSANSCASVFFHTPTWSTNSEITLITELVPGGGNPAQQFGASARSHTEWILKSGTKYLVQILNISASTITAVLNMQFYELSL